MTGHEQGASERVTLADDALLSANWKAVLNNEMAAVNSKAI